MLREGFGIKGLTGEVPNELEDITEKFLEMDGPCLCEYKVEPQKYAYRRWVQVRH